MQAALIEEDESMFNYSRGVAKPTRFIGAYVVLADLPALAGGSDGANAVATATTKARHTMVREIMVDYYAVRALVWGENPVQVDWDRSS